MSLRAADLVAWLEVEPANASQDGPEAELEVVATRLPQGPPVTMRGSSALVWLVAVEGGTDDEVVARVAEASGQPTTVVGPDVRTLLDDLVTRGLLSRDRPRD